MVPPKEAKTMMLVFAAAVLSMAAVTAEASSGSSSSSSSNAAVSELLLRQGLDLVTEGYLKHSVGCYLQGGPSARGLGYVVISSVSV